MNNYIILTNNKPNIISYPPEVKISSEKVALELVAACVENGTDRLLLTSNNLTEGFYNLRTGLAGEVLQKLTNYDIIAAIVMPSNLIPPGHFSELVYELNKGFQFRFFDTEEAAIEWLVSLQVVQH